MPSIQKAFNTNFLLVHRIQEDDKSAEVARTAASIELKQFQALLISAESLAKLLKCLN